MSSLSSYLVVEMKESDTRSDGDGVIRDTVNTTDWEGDQWESLPTNCTRKNP